ncbi:histidine--tRNA ligase [Microgenomates group bacterium RIFCSPHIGHO2_01_FULL_45_11]|nr:MAG: histidine--tRNA ligase [Microgenomates group bacterium RIFCSPHIGHO2_01_FULL_45_11]
MKKTIQPLKGFRDLLPDDAKKRQWVKNIMVEVAESFGYEPIETPTLEPLGLFEGEIGEDEKLFFKFEDQGGRNVALRYDQTVPTCRFVGNNLNKIVFPFRRYQFQNVFRAEKPQKGRYREFTQFDVDIFGFKDPTADAEVMAVNLDTYLKIGFKKPIIVFNNRDLMKDIPYPAIVAIDKLKKIGRQGVITDMVDKGIDKNQAVKYLDYIQNIKPDETIRIITSYLENAGFSKEFYRFEPTLARSFSYSQGPIWEIVIEDYTVGSVGGGERYDGMMQRLTGQDIPATGIAYGFDRTVEAADQFGLIPSRSVSRVLVIFFSNDLQDQTLQVAKQLRQAGINTELYPIADKLGKQLKYADRKGIPYVVVIGPDEAKSNVVKLKDMKTGEEKLLKSADVVRLLTAA